MQVQCIALSAVCDVQICTPYGVRNLVSYFNRYHTLNHVITTGRKGGCFNRDHNSFRTRCYQFETTNALVNRWGRLWIFAPSD
jgi:hypothetical protein